MGRITRLAGLAGITLLLVPLVTASASSTKDAKTIIVALPGEPPSLDPQLGTDTFSAQVTNNLMDPLVRLERSTLKAVPNLASGWTVSGGGKIYTILLRHTGRWTNGRPVTAQDFEYSWKRELDPKSRRGYAYIMYGIKGALAYNTCKRNCARLRDRVGVKALDKWTIRVTLGQSQPWFPYLLAHNVFFAVPRAAVERWGNKWTEPSHIVTNGAVPARQLAARRRGRPAEWNGWRDAGRVAVERVNVADHHERDDGGRGFQAGRVDALTTQMLGPADIPHWQGQAGRTTRARSSARTSSASTSRRSRT